MLKREVIVPSERPPKVVLLERPLGFGWDMVIIGVGFFVWLAVFHFLRAI